MGVQIFRTDEQGSIVAESNGTEITWNCAPSETWKAGETTESSYSETLTSTEEFVKEDSSTVHSAEEAPVTNKNIGVEVHITETGKKYHSAGCQYLKKSDIPISLEDAKNRGYEPCSKCNPPQ